MKLNPYLNFPGTCEEAMNTYAKVLGGEIVAIGSGKVGDDGKVTPMTVKVGDSVLYGKYAGTEISIDGTDYLIMRESDIFAVYAGK